MAAPDLYCLQNSLGRNQMPEHFTMPRHWSLTLLPREVENFPRGYRHFKHVPPLTYLIYLSPKELYALGLLKHYGYFAMNPLTRFELFS